MSVTRNKLVALAASLVLAAVVTSSVLAYLNLARQASEPLGSELTVYNQNLALVKEYRRVNLTDGLNEIRVTNIAATINPASVSFRDLNDTATLVLEQNYQYDLVSYERLLQRYLNQEVTVETSQGPVTGILLSFSGDQVVLKQPAGVVVLSGVRKISLPDLPDGLLVKPTLVWLVETKTGGEHIIEVTYLASNIKWLADYVAIVNKEDTGLDRLIGWVTVQNDAGATYYNAKLKVVAGELHLVTPEGVRFVSKEAVDAALLSQALFQEEKLFEYYLYRLARPTTVHHAEQKQILFTAAQQIRVAKEYTLDWERMGRKVLVTLAFDNTLANGLGVPLPAGTVRIYKPDSEGQLQFLGEDRVDHTPKDERIRLTVGVAFDLVAERKQLDYKRISDRTVQYTYEIKIRNHGDNPAGVHILEHAFGEWQILSSSHAFTKIDATTLSFTPVILPNSEATITYTIQLTW